MIEPDWLSSTDRQPMLAVLQGNSRLERIAITRRSHGMLLKAGYIILVAHRRLFAKDEPRFFIGRVDAYEVGVVRVTGHSFLRDMFTGRMLEKADQRTKLLSLSSGTLIVYVLPEQVSLEALRFVTEDRRLVITDGKEFTMNLAEFVRRGQP